MVGVLVGDEDSVDGFRSSPIAARRSKVALAAESGIDKNARARGTDEGAVARTAAGEHADFDDNGLRKRARERALKLQFSSRRKRRYVPMCSAAYVEAERAPRERSSEPS